VYASRNMFFYLALSLIPCFSWASVCESHINCQNKFLIQKNYLTYFSTHKIDKIQPKIKRLVIVVHGALRNGHDYFDDTVIAAKKLSVENTTLIIAPTFRKITDEREDGELYWGRKWYTKWKYGYKSEDSDRISSFSVMDKLILKIANSNSFPNLKSIIVTGHSAGGQFTQRYGIATKIGKELLQTFTIVPSNPSSYMYLDDVRYHFSDGNFEIAQRQKDCTGFNHYIYGPIDRAEYMQRYNLSELRENFKNQKIIYLMSEEDKGVDSLDRSCEAMTQGRNRFERAKNYFYYVKKNITSDQHRFVSIPLIGHEHVDVYQSKEAAHLIFGVKKRKTPSFLYTKIGDSKDIVKSSDYQFVMFGGGKNEISGMINFMRAARGGDLLVISGKENLNHRYTHDFWNIAEQEKINLNSVETISFLDRKAGDNKFILEKIRNAEAIFFTGGDQSKYINRIKDTHSHRELLNKIRSGVSIGGTSAGLAIMSEFIFSAQKGGLSSKYVLRNPHTGYISLEHDFFYSPLLKNLITDTHFSERKREGRLLGFMFRVQYEYRKKEIYGLGIDEQTSLTLNLDNKMKTNGVGNVTLYKSPAHVPGRSLNSLSYGPILKKVLAPGKTLPHYSEMTFSHSIQVQDGEITP
jgi:cyanophycinase